MFNEVASSEKAKLDDFSPRFILWCLFLATVAAFGLSIFMVAYSAHLMIAVTFIICLIAAIVLVWRRVINVGIALIIIFFGPMLIPVISFKLVPLSRPIYCVFVHETPAEFWEWFGKHSLDFRHRSFLNEHELDEHIRRVDPRLYCEISNVQSDGYQTLTIRPGEDSEALPIAERVASEAQDFKNWHVVACRPRQALETELGGYPAMEWLDTHYPGGGCYQTKDILFILKDGVRSANIELYLRRDRNGLDDDQCHQLAEKMIEDSLGERDYILMVEKIDVFSGDITIPSSARPIAELTAVFDHWVGKTKRDFRSGDKGPTIRSHKGLRRH